MFGILFDFQSVLGWICFDAVERFVAISAAKPIPCAVSGFRERQFADSEFLCQRFSCVVLRSVGGVLRSGGILLSAP